LEKKWNILQKNETTTKALKESLKINETICAMLVQRGISNFEDAKNYFRPDLNKLHDPWLMKDMRKAVDRVDAAILKNEKILVFGDYDVDGTTAVASFYQFLCSIYNPEFLDYYIPHRYREGYGVSRAGIDFASANGFKLIVCLDCGIKSVELIDYAKSLGIDFIICDHHLPGNVLPNACAILNPKQIDCNYPYKELCGCGVGFKFMMALSAHYKKDADYYLRYLDLVAVAIAADIVPITDENRILAYHGLHKINTNPSLGIKTIIKLGSIQKKLTITNVVFIIAPRVNAAGRMDDARKAVQLFIEQNETDAVKLGEMLQSDNKERKETDSSITQEALEILQEDVSFNNKKSCVIYREHWHKGVVGIVASRIIEHHYKPTIVLTLSDGIVTGSARSVKGFNLHEAIYACKEHLLVFGGHFAAAGLSMLPENVEAFKNKFEEVVAATIKPESLIREIVIDAEIQFSEINQSLFNIISQMEPFGPENMRPVFMAKNVIDTGYSKLLKEQHVKFVVKQYNISQNGIGFKMPEKLDLLQSKQPVDLVFSLEENEWNGNVTIQLMVDDCKLSTQP
jgi:single-stranded-DNA-specific exonuclease